MSNVIPHHYNAGFSLTMATNTQCKEADTEDGLFFHHSFVLYLRKVGTFPDMKRFLKTHEHNNGFNLWNNDCLLHVTL